MHIQFRVNGYYDWEKAELHPGVQITPADVKALRAKQDADGRWLVRVEKKTATHHDANIPESAICEFIVWQAVHAGNEWSRHDAAVELMKVSYKHHGRQDHIEEVHVHDQRQHVAVHPATGEKVETWLKPHEELIDAKIEHCLQEYSDQLDAQALEAGGVKIIWEKGETWQEALARAKSTDAGKQAIDAAGARTSATLASARRTCEAAKARYLDNKVEAHTHIKAHFGSHLKKGA